MFLILGNFVTVVYFTALQLQAWSSESDPRFSPPEISIITVKVEPRRDAGISRKKSLNRQPQIEFVTGSGNKSVNGHWA